MNLDKLLTTTANLESGHPIEAVLAQNGISRRYSAYDVVLRYKKILSFYEGATTQQYKTTWANAAANLEPVINAIEKYLRTLEAAAKEGVSA
jgi:hypothetical protein